MLILTTLTVFGQQKKDSLNVTFREQKESMTQLFSKKLKLDVVYVSINHVKDSCYISTILINENNQDIYYTGKRIDSLLITRGINRPLCCSTRGNVYN
jgi:bifunctional DNase/RNase